MKCLSALLSLLLLWLALAPFTRGQQKKPLDHDVYAIWNEIHEQAISNDGRWVLARMGPENEDAELRVKSTVSNQSYRVPRGNSAHFSEDSRFVAFLIKSPRAVVRQAKLAKKKGDDLPKDSLGILEVTTGNVSKVGRVQSFKMPEEASGWIAYLLEKSEEQAEADSTKAEAAEEKEQKEDADDKKDKDKKEGTPLVLRNLATGAETRYNDAVDYAFSEDGRWLVYTASNKEGSTNGIYAINTETTTATPIMTGKGVYTQLVMDEAGTQVAFLSNRDDFEADQTAFTLYHWHTSTDAPAALATEGTTGVPADWWIGEHGDVAFSKEGTRLFFGTAPRPAPEDTTAILDEEQVGVDIWHWKDAYLQPMQLEQMEDEKKRTYQAVVHLNDGRVVQLADETMPDVIVGSEGEAAIAFTSTNVPYRQLISWDYPGYFDVYLIDVVTGERRRVLEKIQYSASLSPDARYLTWWDRDELAWYALHVADESPINLTSAIPHPVHNEQHDWPYKPNPYGNAGWTEDDAAFLVYDKHDLWVIDPNNPSAARAITEGRGRADNLRFRYVKLDPDQQAIATDAPMLLSAFHLGTRAEGFYRDRIAGDREPTRLVMEDRSFSTPTKADDADRLLFTRESFAEFPNLWVSNLDLDDRQQITDANPQQDDYLWGTVEQMSWTSVDGTPLEGLLYKPDNFDVQHQYPMMVYFYEKNADNLHRHHAPEPHRSVINITFYTSRGYVVFVPDIVYKTGYPGESAMQSVMPGVTEVMKRGFVDPARIGVQGHSWGGYQIAYMVTRTNLFRAAEAGAPVANMVSAYGGIRWGTGMSRMFQYEQTQSRIGGSLWEYPMRYLDNSPIFRADQIETPLLIMHNDHDGAVPWYQGIELFVALRRLGKPTWMINYNGEPHWPTTYPNKRDWAIRMQQFFDHYLQDAPAPQWMTEGVPAIDKGTTLGLEPAEPAMQPVSSEEQ